MNSVERLTELAKTLPEIELARVIGYIEGLAGAEEFLILPEATPHSEPSSPSRAVSRRTRGRCRRAPNGPTPAMSPACSSPR